MNFYALRHRGLELPVCVCLVVSAMSDSSQPHGLQPSRLLCPWNSPGKKAGVGRHALLQGIFLTQGPHKAPPNGFSSSSNFLRALHTVFRSCCPVLKSYQQCTKLLVSLLSHQYLLFSDFIFIFNLSVSGLLLWGVGFSPVVAPGRQSKPGLDCCSLWGELPYSMCDLNSLTRDRTWVPCAGRQILNHWTTRVSFFLSPHTIGCRGIFQCGFIYISLIVRLSIVLGAYWSFVYNLEKCLSKSFPCFVIEFT